MQDDMVMLVFRCTGRDAALVTAKELSCFGTAEFLLVCDARSDMAKRVSQMSAALIAIETIRTGGGQAVVVTNDDRWRIHPIFGARTIVCQDRKLLFNAFRKKWLPA